jgi:cytochrome c553
MNKTINYLLLAGLLGAGAASAAPERMAERTAACVACHGKQGRASADGLYPRLAGKPQAYLYQQLLHFRDGRRTHAQMAYLLAPLSDAYLGEMAAWFAAQQLPYPAPQEARVAPAIMERGRKLVFDGERARKIPACVACHGQQLAGVRPAIPGLLGLPRDYLNLQFGAWRNGVRHGTAPDCMAMVANRLTADEVAAVAAWLSSQNVPAGYAPAAAATAALPVACAGMP